jgi:hypothetical protein
VDRGPLERLEALQGGSPLQKLLEGTDSPTGRINHESMESWDTVPQFFCDVMSDA